MDIFVRNVPNQASAKNLESFFRDEFRPFRIHEFACHKPRGRGYAIVTVLDAAKAQSFLKIHGEVSLQSLKQLRTPPLKYMDRLLLCAPSRNKPDEILLQTLRKDAKDKICQTRSVNSPTVSSGKVERKFDYTTVKCGLWEYNASQLVFVYHASDVREGSIMFGKKNLTLVAPSIAPVQRGYRLDVPYPSILSVAIGNVQDPSITLTLIEAPRVYQEPANDLTSVLGSLCLRPAGQGKPRRRRVACLDGVNENVMSSCFAYRILISNPGSMRRIRSLHEQGREMPPSIPWCTPVYRSSSYATDRDRLASTLLNRYRSLGFGVQFQVQRLGQNGYLPHRRILELLPHIFQISLRSGCPIGAQSVRKLSRKLPFADPEVDPEIFATKKLEEVLSECEKVSLREMSHTGGSMKHYPHIVLVHKATVTPAGIYLEGPEPEISNRVLRAYSDNTDCFLRVRFCDEDGERVSFSPFISLEEIFHSRFQRVLDGVISIAGRDFEFLGFSHSSLRDQTCWFMAPFIHNGELLNARAVIAGLGDFSSIRSPAKCAARIGQAFSSTDGAVKIPSDCVRVIPDVERNTRVFSDGVGTISTKILAMIWKDYTPSRGSKPTLFQVRYAGT